VKGENEIKFLAKLILSAFRGFAFDDFTSYEHAWELSEIETNCIFNGRGFFDYSRRCACGQ
jgi:hypothetical protein